MAIPAPSEGLFRIQPLHDDNFSLNQGGPVERNKTPAKDYYDYTYANGVYTRLIDAWMVISEETERQRDLRYVKHSNSADLRASGMLKADEMYSPVRLIDTNIRAEQPPSVAYVTQSRRSIIFASPDGSTITGLEKLEEDFTVKARYLGWEVPFIQTLDGAAAHGWDSVEILFDADAPGNFVFEHIGPDRLIFGLDCESLDSQEVVCIQKNLTAKQLKSLVKEGFNPDQVEQLISYSKKAGASTSTDDCACITYKVFFKLNEIVHVCWFARNLSDYLRNPEPLFLGVRDTTGPKQPINPDDPTDIRMDYAPIYESEFPIIINKYIESNDPRIVEISGRVKLDEASQEAGSAIQSGLVNGILRAANIYASPKERAIDSDPTANTKATDTVLFNGAIYDKPLEFFHTPYPEASVIQALQTVVTGNRQEAGAGPAWGVINRKDSGKTATEVQAATEKSTELNSVQVILLSIFIRICYAKAWRIYQSRVLQGAIGLSDANLLYLFADKPQLEQQQDGNFVIVASLGPKKYIIKSSGDVDVIQRQERLQRLMQGWEVFGKTPLAPEYLKDIVRYAFPEDAQRYIQVLEGAEQSEVNNLKHLVMQLSSVVMGLVQAALSGQDVRAMVQAHAMQLQGLRQQVASALGVPDQQGQQGQGQPQQLPTQQQQPQQLAS